MNPLSKIDIDLDDYSGVENVELTGSATSAVGDGVANELSANATEASHLDGKGGDDNEL